MTELAPREATLSFNSEHVELIKKTIAPDLTNIELQLFIHVAKTAGLDPLMRQIHVVKRRTKQGDRVTFQVGIDGYRLIADRTGKYAGSDDAIFLYADEDKTGEKPLQASVTVWKMVAGMRCSFSATARWSQYFPGNQHGEGFMWLKMPHVMLAKCAEALALRKAFPAELCNLYVKEEMDQAESAVGEKPVTVAADYSRESLIPSPPLDEQVPPPTDADFIPDETDGYVSGSTGNSEEGPPVPKEDMITPGQSSYLHVLRKVFPSEESFRDYLRFEYSVDSTTKLTKRQASELIEYLRKRKENG